MRALITGITGQDGSYLAESLAADDAEVLGTCRSGNRRGLSPNIEIREVELTDRAGLTALVEDFAPDQVFHLAALSSVAASWADPVLTCEVNATASMTLLQACWQSQQRRDEPVRFVQASSAEIFGQAEAPQTERTPIRPVNPYGAAKALAHLAVGVYRGRGLGASSLVLYNHESPRRPPAFVTRKITSTVARIVKGEVDELRLGNLDTRRDWGWAPDYVRAMRLAADAAPDDFVIATGESHSIRDFVIAAFNHVGITDWQSYVVVDPAFYRPVDPTEQVGDASHARQVLGWQPSVTFHGLVAAMMEADLQ